MALRLIARSPSLRRLSTSAPRVSRQFSTAQSFDEEDYWKYPNESLGNNYAVNWALAKDSVSPSGDAYRNLSIKEFLRVAKGKVDANRALYATRSADAPVTFEDGVSRGIFKQASEYFTQTAPAMYVEDAAVGSHRDHELRVRVISDSWANGLAMRHMLVPIPVLDVSAFQQEITVYFAAQHDFGTGSAFVATNAETGVVVAGNGASVDSVLAALTRLAALRAGGITLACDSCVDKNSNPSLIFGAGGNTGDAPLYGAHGHVWGENGVARLFSGVRGAASDEPRRGDLIEEGPAGVLVTRKLDHGVNLLSHPTSVVLTDGSGKKGKVTAETAADIFLKGGASGLPCFATAASLAGEPADLADSFCNLLKQHNVEAFTR